MKKTFTTTVLAAYFLLMSSLGIMAAAPGQVKKSSKEEVRREIIRSISCPDFLTSDAEVKALVQVDEDGNVNIQEINTSNTELKNYVQTQLEHIKVRNNNPVEKFVLVIKFKMA